MFFPTPSENENGAHLGVIIQLLHGAIAELHANSRKRLEAQAVAYTVDVYQSMKIPGISISGMIRTPLNLA